MKYRIRWVSKFTGATGAGTGEYSLGEAERYAHELNVERDAICFHTVEPVPETNNGGDNGKPNTGGQGS